MTSLAVRSRAEEQMDAEDLDAETYGRVLRDLSRVNRWTFTAQPTLHYLGRATRGMSRFRLLDVGFGAGDMLRAIAHWARRRGIEAELIGVDLNPRSATVAEGRHVARPGDRLSHRRLSRRARRDRFHHQQPGHAPHDRWAIAGLHPAHGGERDARLAD